MIEEASLPVVTFGLGGARLAIPARAVASMAPDGEAAGPIEDLLGLAPEADGPARILTLRLGDTQIQTRVPGEVSMAELRAGAIHPLPHLVRARMTLKGLAALALDGDGVILVIDPARF
jgi:hypothetical protein